MSEKKTGSEPWVNLNSLNLEDTIKGFEAFKEFWEDCKGKVSNNQDLQKELDSQLKEWPKRSHEIGFELAKYRDFAGQIPVCVALADWIKGYINDRSWKERYFNKIVQLYKHNIIPVVHSDGALVPLEYFIYYGHSEVIEQIRCVKSWTFLEHEDLVQCYLQFSRNLSRQSCGIIPPAFDPDRERVRFKGVKYEKFINLVQNLSERDALMAKLLYFGAPSIEQVLNLKKNVVDVSLCAIHFAEGPINFPKHLIYDIDSYAKAKAPDEEFLFTNFRGQAVERTHLHQSFSRACAKMSPPSKITPGLLLRVVGESSEDELIE